MTRPRPRRRWRGRRRRYAASRPPPTSTSSAPRSRSAAPARDWSAGARTSRGQAGVVRRRAVLGPADPRLGVADPGRARSSASPPPPTAPTAPAGSSPATAPGTGCSPRCTGSGWPPRPPASHAADGLELVDTRMVATVRCAPPQNKPTTAERDTCAPWIEAELALLVEHVRVVVALGSIGWDATLRSFRGDRLAGPAAQAAVRPRRRGDAHRRRPARSRCSAATTRASRTPSPAGSPSRCWTRCWDGPPPYAEPAPVSQPAEETALKAAQCGFEPHRGHSPAVSDRLGLYIEGHRRGTVRLNRFRIRRGKRNRHWEHQIMQFRKLVDNRLVTVLAGATVVALVGAGAGYSAGTDHVRGHQGPDDQAQGPQAGDRQEAEGPDRSGRPGRPRAARPAPPSGQTVVSVLGSTQAWDATKPRCRSRRTASSSAPTPVLARPAVRCAPTTGMNEPAVQLAVKSLVVLHARIPCDTRHRVGVRLACSCGSSSQRRADSNTRPRTGDLHRQHAVARRLDFPEGQLVDVRRDAGLQSALASDDGGQRPGSRGAVVDDSRPRTRTRRSPTICMLRRLSAPAPTCRHMLR